MGEGYVQLYTGDGKGKTTASMGLAIRSVGAGMTVYIGQFIKTIKYNEIHIIEKRMPEITVELFGGTGCFLDGKPSNEDVMAAKDGIDRAIEVLNSGKYGLVILDELAVAESLDLIDMADVDRVLNARKPWVELVITGRYASDSLIAKADLVTNMECVKHYYDRGVNARNGIER